MDCASEALPLDVDPRLLGETIRRVLDEGARLPAAPDGPDNFDDQLGRRFGLKDGKSLYAGVRMVFLEEVDGELTCGPSRHRRGFNYEAFPDDWKGKEEIHLPAGSSDADWGAAALEALRRSV